MTNKTMNENDQLSVAKYCLKFKEKYSVDGSLPAQEDIDEMVRATLASTDDACIFALWASANVNLNFLFAYHPHVQDKMIKVAQRAPGNPNFNTVYIPETVWEQAQKELEE